MRHRFKTYEQLVSHIESISSDNHTVLGNWTAGQNFYHLASAFQGSIDGLPDAFSPLVRAILHPGRKLVTHFRFPPWLPIPKSIRHKLSPPTDACFEIQKKRLLAEIRRFLEFQDEYPPHPVLGKLTRNEWYGFHLRHCEHHLAFIELGT